MYRKSSKGWLKHFDFILIDLISLHLAFVLSYVCRHGIGNPYKNLLYRNMAFMLTFIDFFVVFLFETLKGVLRRGYYQELAATVKHVILVMLLAVLYLFTIQEGTSFSRSVLYFTAVFYIIFAYVTRILWKKHLQKRMENGGDRSLLIITSSDIAAEVVRSMQEHNYQRFNLVGIVLVDKDMKGQKIEGIPVLANEEEAANYVCREWIDEVFLVISEKYPYPQKLADQLLETGVTVHLNLAKMADAIGKKQLVEKLGDYTVLTTSINYATVKQAFMKRSLDIIGGLAGCILTGIIFIFVAPAIYIQSPGPIFFSQIRVGKNGKKFKMYKFRSMYMDAEERKKELMKDNRVEDGMMFKLEFDPRVIGNKILPNGEKKTGIGNFIRKTSLDEFPQFFNVLKGDMSLVGTRPPTLDEWEKYELHHRARLAIKPGITGMWQVSGRSDITDFEEVVKLDMKYIANWNFGVKFKTYSGLSFTYEIKKGRNGEYTKELWIENSDFFEVPPPKFKRLTLGSEVRLMGAYLVRCTGVDKDENGKVVAIHAEADLETRNGNPADGRKVRGTIHWVSCAHCLDAEVELYDKLFTEANMNSIPDDADFKDYLNPDSVKVLQGAKLEESLKDAKPGDRFQFVRNGYFTPDSKHEGVYNRIVTLKDSFKL